MIRCCIVFLCLFGLVSAQIDWSFEEFQGNEALQQSSIGVSILDATNGKQVFGYQADKFFYPASIQKTITTAAACQLLGADFKYITQVYIDGAIVDGVLEGNLLINPIGDPTINSGYFNPNFKAAVIQALKNKGVETIKGEVLLFDAIARHGTPQSWLFEDIGNYYGVAPQLFNYKDNLYYLTFQQAGDGKQAKVLKVNPSVPYIFDNQVLCSSTQTGDHSYILGAPFSLEREIVGTITAGVGTFTIKGANAHPLYTFTEELKEVFTIQNEKLKTVGPHLLVESSSPKLVEIIETTNFESVNLFAEGLLNTLGFTMLNEYSNQAGIEVLEDYMVQKGIDSKQIKMKDGSGLSRLNAMTPDFATQWVFAHLDNEIFKQSLPLSGVSGTLRYLNYPGIKSRIYAKSGSADGVVNYVGHFKDDKGKPYVFSIFINHAYGSKYKIRKAIGVFLEQCLKGVE